jgi:hypothetical protein
MDPELRVYLDDMRQELRQETATLGGEMRQEMVALRGEVRQEMATLRGEMREEMHTLGETLRGEMRQGDAETRRELGTLIEAQRHDLAAVAEGVVANRVAIDRLGLELRQEMDERFETVQLAFVRVRRDIAQLRSPRRRKPRDG